jgi:hypothetical protein
VAEDIKTLLLLSEEELLARLADESALGAEPFSFKRKVAVGRAIFAGWWEELKDTLCPRQREFTESDSAEDRVRDAAALLDIIATAHSNVPAATITVLIVKYGLERLCSDWAPPAAGLVGSEPDANR